MAAKPCSFPHGGGIEAAAKAWGCDISEILDLSTGLHPAGAPGWLPAWLQANASLVAHYPESGGEPASSALAEAFGIAVENVLICAGAQAVIEVIFQAMGWHTIAMEVPCYNEPIRCAQRTGCELRSFGQGHDIPDADALWWTSPANPSGREVAFPDGYSGVLDESYLSFAKRRKLGVKDGVIRLGSLTKNFCIPGLRLGYVVADRATVQQLNEWLPPWPASTLAQHLLPHLLQEADERDEQIVRDRARLSSLLKSYGWEVCASEASFLMARPKQAMPDFTAQKILVRPFPEWPQLTGWLRLGIPGDESDWQRLERSLCRSH